MSKQYMVNATFTRENLKTPAAEYMIGLTSTFYCGEDLEEALTIYEQLPNKDKQLLLAAVNYTTMQGQKFIKDWKIIKELQYEVVKNMKVIK